MINFKNRSLTSLSAFSFFVFISYSFLYSQSINSSLLWYFGNKAGLNFSTYPPIPIKGKLNTYEGCSTISDENGDLLFYTDGVTIYNSDHNVMDNGQNLKGSSSSTQSSVVVRMPGKGSEKKYYVFTVEVKRRYPSITYSLVDMSINAGKGKVVSKNQNVLKMPILSEKIASTIHKNGKDVWLIFHGSDFTRPLFSKFVIFLLTEKGLKEVKRIDAKELDIFSTGYVGDSFDRRGYLKFSNEGDKLAMCILTISKFGSFPKTRLYIMDFDNSNGDITNIKEIDEKQVNPPYEWGFYGVEFSFDDRFLYATQRYGKLIQYDLSLPNIAQIRAQKVEMGNSDSYFNAIQKSVNGRIYIARSKCHPSTDFFTTKKCPKDYTQRRFRGFFHCICPPSYPGESYIAEIKYPQKKGTDMDLVQNAIKVDSSYEGLPQFINYNLSSNIDYEGYCQLDRYKIFFKQIIKPNTYFEWDFGDGNTFRSKDQKYKTVYHNYKKPGIYDVKMTYFFHGTNKSIATKKVIVNPPPAVDISYLPKSICDKDLPYKLTSPSGVSGHFEINGKKVEL